MPYDPDDTIAAIASAAGGAARGIVRISGPRAISCARALLRPADRDRLDAIRRPMAIAVELALSALHSLLPTELYVWPSSQSFTRQPVVEMHTIGSPPLLQMLLRAICQAGARLAEPGEFTLRAFLAGRLDLTQAEAVLGLIDSNNRREFETALSQLAGGLSGTLARLRSALLDLLAHLEAGLDFVEEDIEFITATQLAESLGDAIRQVDQLVQQTHMRQDASDRLRVVIAGWPNVGKSSLFNALIGTKGSEQTCALVSPLAGTTRDYVTAEFEFGGVPCLLIDTAGVNLDSDDEISSAAQSQGQRQRSAGHLELLCIDSTRELNVWERTELGAKNNPNRIVVLTKADQIRADQQLSRSAIFTSAISGLGIDELRIMMAERAAASTAHSAVVATTAVRCQDSLRLAAECLWRARELVSRARAMELVAAEVRVALAEIGKVAGEIYTDDVLDRVFSRFCIGK